jgi:hypothetical protein
MIVVQMIRGGSRTLGAECIQFRQLTCPIQIQNKNTKYL